MSTSVTIADNGITCTRCHQPMTYNVPRLGPNGGYVHQGTGRVECEPITAGEGYRLLAPDEPTIEGDEVRPADDKKYGMDWRIARNWISNSGKQSPDQVYRRRIEQPAPATGIEAEVCADIAKRQQVGIKKYDVTLAENDAPLSARIRHAFEESADQTCYLKWAEKEAAVMEARILELEDALRDVLRHMNETAAALGGYKKGSKAEGVYLRANEILFKP